VVFGGLVFNLATGAPTGLNVMFGMDVRVGAVVTAESRSCVLVREMGKALDIFTKVPGADDPDGRRRSSRARHWPKRRCDRSILWSSIFCLQ
jgi:hypothetical protein